MPSKTAKKTSKRPNRRASDFKLSPAHKSQDRLLGETSGYLMGAVLYPLKSKWGISDKEKLRRAQVDKDVSGPVYTVFSREIIFGWTCEQLVHFIYHFQNAPMSKGTGRTEWYYNLNPVFGTAFLWFTYNHGQYFEALTGFKLSIWYNALAYLCPFIWIDGFLWLVLFRLIGWALAACLLFGIYYFSSQSF